VQEFATSQFHSWILGFTTFLLIVICLVASKLCKALQTKHSKTYLLATIEFACIECNRLSRSTLFGRRLIEARGSGVHRLFRIRRPVHALALWIVTV
jgi:hypothetical protein